MFSFFFSLLKKRSQKTWQWEIQRNIGLWKIWERIEVLAWSNASIINFSEQYQNNNNEISHFLTYNITPSNHFISYFKNSCFYTLFFPIVRSQIGWKWEQNILYKDVETSLRRVLKFYGKIQTWQYLLTVGLDYYKWCQSQTQDIKMGVDCEIPHWLKRERGSKRKLDLEKIPH